MRVCFLVPSLSPSGGIHLVQDYARRLAEDHGAEVAVVPVLPGPELDAARSQSWDVALAAWWTTVPHLYEFQAAGRGVLGLGFDPLHYRSGEFVDRLAATAAFAAPFDVLAVTEWVCEMVRAIRPSARCTVVPPGIDRAVFRGPREPADGPLRVLIEGHPSLWFKGVAEAHAAVAGMKRPPHVVLPGDRIGGGFNPEGMAQLYRETDVVLKLGRFEGIGLAPLEAMHVGVPCVVTPYGGYVEYVRHGENALVVGFDDIPGATRALDRLDEDRQLLAQLSEGALLMTETWPDPAASTAMLYEALATLAGGDQDSALMETIIRQTTPNRVELERLNGLIEKTEQALAHELRRVEELDRSRTELSAQLKDVWAALEVRSEELRDCQARNHELGTRLEEATSSRAYRAAIALRSLLPGRR